MLDQGEKVIESTQQSVRDNIQNNSNGVIINSQSAKGLDLNYASNSMPSFY